MNQMPPTAPPAIARFWVPLLLALSPVTVALTAAGAAAIFRGFALPLHGHELLAAALVATLSGILSVLPFVLAVRRGRSDDLAMAALKGIGLRIILMLVGTLLALIPGLRLAPIPLIIWVLVYYFPLLAVETAAIACILKGLDSR